jgi:catalase
MIMEVALAKPTKRKVKASKSSDSEATYGELAINRGKGGETHQVAGDNDAPPLTTQQGVVFSDDQNSLRAGERGPLLVEDFAFREKIFHFDHERIPERVVHARGFGAHGYFETLESLSDITRVRQLRLWSREQTFNPL